MASAMLAVAPTRAQPHAGHYAAPVSRRRAPTVREIAKRLRALERRIDRFSPDEFDRECCGGPTDQLYYGLREQLAVAPARDLCDLAEKVALLRKLLEVVCSDPGVETLAEAMASDLRRMIAKVAND